MLNRRLDLSSEVLTRTRLMQKQHGELKPSVDKRMVDNGDPEAVEPDAKLAPNIGKLEVPRGLGLSDHTYKTFRKMRQHRQLAKNSWQFSWSNASTTPM